MNSKIGKDLPEGLMFNPLDNNKVVTVESVETDSKKRLEAWDVRRKGHKFYWGNDPSYWWAVTKKRKSVR